MKRLIVRKSASGAYVEGILRMDSRMLPGNLLIRRSSSVYTDSIEKRFTGVLTDVSGYTENRLRLAARRMFREIARYKISVSSRGHSPPSNRVHRPVPGVT
ncbi:uncharacterized protein LOC143351568 isoform X2 [Colletes latitarsis]|uniref:uncharacterized protein LOC143351568 isoform X2 n=1 Tax=Colletes latitarsis TaxID=2605962 RepID=UPI0040362F56